MNLNDLKKTFENYMGKKTALQKEKRSRPLKRRERKKQTVFFFSPLIFMFSLIWPHKLTIFYDFQ